jgi:5'-3' exonuclease
LNREVEEGVKDSSENMRWQQEKLKVLLPFLGVTQIEIDNIEADDTIGYLVGMLGETRKVVVSSDRDMWQFVSDTTTVYWPTKKVYISSENMSEYVPVRPENYVLFRAMSGKGDASDNIHGIKGLGDKTIIKLFPEFLTRPDMTPDYIFDECRAILEQQGENPKGKFRWYKVIHENADLVRRNVEVMQLTSPEISASAASIIRNLAVKRPSFNMTGFKIALLNNDIQLTDNDMFAVFQEYKMRSENAAA